MMKFKLLDETHFARNDKFQQHYDNHVAKNYHDYFTEMEDELIEPMSIEEYDTNGDILSKAVVSSSDFNTNNRYVGFVMEDGRVLKCDKTLSEIVIYKSTSLTNSNTITYYKVASHRLKNRYEKLKSKHYSREITPEDDKFNL